MKPLSLVLLTAPALATTATLQWSPDTNTNSPALGYIIRWGTNSSTMGNYVNTNYVGLTNSITLSWPETWTTNYFRVTATNRAGESWPSEEIMVTPPAPATPDGFHLQSVTP